MITARTIHTLCRSGIALFTAASAVTGWFVLSPFVSTLFFMTAAGVFLLACGSSALNQYQEQDLDKRMERTRHRPIPAGSLSPGRALGIALMLITIGLTMLVFAGRTAAFLGLFAVAWYNGVYTPLKRKTPVSVLLGSLVGAIAPMIGWTAAGGRLDDPRIAALSLLFLLWQVPHFCLLLMRHADEYRCAGIPTIASSLPLARLSAITSLWSAAVATASLLLPFTGVIRTILAARLLLIPAFAVFGLAVGSLRAAGSPGRHFRRINAFLVVIMALITLDSLLRGAIP